MSQQIQLRRGTAAAWTSANSTLAQGEMGIETDTGKFKFGDGSTAWTLLAYVDSGGGSANLTLETNGSLNSSQSVLNLVAGTNVTLTNTANGNVTISASGGGGGGNANAIALETNGNLNISQSVLNLVAGNNVTLTNTANGNVTISASGGGGGGGGWTQIAQVVVGTGNSSTITFNSIPSTFTNLQLIVTGIATTNNNGVLLNFNGDFGNNYDWISYNNSAHTNAGQIEIALFGGSNFWNGAPGQAIISIPSYTNNAFYKVASSTMSAAYGGPSGGSWFEDAFIGGWHSTATIANITITCGITAFLQGTTATLYGY